MSVTGHCIAVTGGSLIPEATSWTMEAQSVRLASCSWTPASPFKGVTSGDGGGIALMELAHTAILSLWVREAPLRADSKSVT